MNVVKIEPGDTIVLECSDAITAEHAARIKAAFREKSPELADNPLLVLGGIKFKVVRPSAGLEQLSAKIISPSEMRERLGLTLHCSSGRCYNCSGPIGCKCECHSVPEGL